ncbi:hypothetical protein GCM10009827_113530 [Dactylosporangium maewongense]|uniref:Uncharacterized protein n=1 Tax=Dactylosporangium maewongense TaxID=634393 RepID=A0ABN2D945_9ACTN
MGYSVRPTGRLHLPAADDVAAATAIRAALAVRDGWFSEEICPDAGAVADLAWVGAAQVVRDGDWIEFARDEQGDAKWSEQATAFYVELAPFVRAGTVSCTGEDGSTWAYAYADGKITQQGWNAWDCSLEPFGEPVYPWRET